MNDERETTINIMTSDDFLLIYTSDRIMADKFKRLGYTLTRVDKTDGIEVSWFFQTMQKCLTFRNIKAVYKAPSEAQIKARTAGAAKLRAMRAKKTQSFPFPSSAAASKSNK